MDDNNETVTVRAMKAIKAGDEVTIQYKGPMLGNVARNKKFKEHWKFTCGCQRCNDPTEMGTFLSAVRCTECSKTEKVGFLLPERGRDGDFTWSCQGCQEEVPDATVANFIQELEDKSVTLGYSAPTGRNRPLIFKGGDLARYIFDVF